jgi:Carbohydrate binding module (family 6)/Cellulase (glycosyl hydrolase family 5)
VEEDMKIAGFRVRVLVAAVALTTPVLAAIAQPAVAQGGSPFGGAPAAIPDVIELENYDLGGQGIAYFDTTPGNRQGTYRNDDVDIYQAGSVTAIGYTGVGEFLNYTVSSPTAKAFDAKIRLNTGMGVAVSLAANGGEVGRVSIPSTGGWSTFVDVSIGRVSLPAGTFTLTLKIESGAANFDSMTFSSATPDPVLSLPTWETDGSGRILTPKGSVYIANGANVGSHGFNDSNGGIYSPGGVPGFTGPRSDVEVERWMKQLRDENGVNSIRFNRQDFGSTEPSFPSITTYLNEVVRCSKIAKKLGMTTMIGHRDADQTGDNRGLLLNAQELNEAVSFNQAAAQAIAANQLNNVWVELSNEVGRKDSEYDRTEWVRQHVVMLTSLRRAGFTGIAVVNDSNMGKGSTEDGSSVTKDSVLLGAGGLDALVALDRQLLGPSAGANGRLVADLHTYVTASTDHLRKVIDQFAAKAIPVVFGEFGSSEDIVQFATQQRAFDSPITITAERGLGVYFIAPRSQTNLEKVQWDRLVPFYLGRGSTPF